MIRFTFSNFSLLFFTLKNFSTAINLKIFANQMKQEIFLNFFLICENFHEISKSESCANKVNRDLPYLTFIKYNISFVHDCPIFLCNFHYLS